MKRSGITLADIADWHNLSAAFHRAARGKGRRDDVRCFTADLEAQLALLRRQILDGSVVVGTMRSFHIRDPKPRIIHAPCFRERVLHHALMAWVGPVLERTLVDDTYACRLGKGTLAAVLRAQDHSRRFEWFAKIDIRAYFASIDHAILLSLLARRLRSPGVLALITRIIDAHHATPGKGLPIGALTSQYFANLYLGGLDRLLLEECRVGGMVRYMDDVVWWGQDKATVASALSRVRDYAATRLTLSVKETALIGRSAPGMTFCGYRILPGRLRLSRRRKRRYAVIRRRWECAFLKGEVDGHTLQAGYGSALALTAHTDSIGWRRAQLKRVALDGALDGNPPVFSGVRT